MNEPDITRCASPAATLRIASRPASPTPCHVYSTWDRFPVIGPALTVLIAIVGALALVSNASAFNDVNAELQIAAREQRLAKQEAERVARAQAARQVPLVATADERKAAPAPRARPAADAAKKEARAQ